MNLPSLNLFLRPPADWWRWLPGIVLLVVIRGSTLQAVPADEPPLKIADPRHNHWSFQPTQRLELPAAELTDWPRNPIDYTTVRLRIVKNV